MLFYLTNSVFPIRVIKFIDKVQIIIILFPRYEIKVIYADYQRCSHKLIFPVTFISSIPKVKFLVWI